MCGKGPLGRGQGMRKVSIAGMFAAWLYVVVLFGNRF